jgi:hypothetical protein
VQHVIGYETGIVDDHGWVEGLTFRPRGDGGDSASFFKRRLGIRQGRLDPIDQLDFVLGR